MRCLLMLLAVLAAASAPALAQESKYYQLPKGDYPHDVAAGIDLLRAAEPVAEIRFPIAGKTWKQHLSVKEGATDTDEVCRLL